MSNADNHESTDVVMVSERVQMIIGLGSSIDCYDLSKITHSDLKRIRDCYIESDDLSKEERGALKSIIICAEAVLFEGIPTLEQLNNFLIMDVNAGCIMMEKSIEKLTDDCKMKPLDGHRIDPYDQIQSLKRHCECCLKLMVTQKPDTAAIIEWMRMYRNLVQRSFQFPEYDSSTEPCE